MPNHINMSQDYAIFINEKLAIYWEEIPKKSKELSQYQRWEEK